MIRKFSAVAIGLLLLAGCVSEQQKFDAAKSVFAKDPKARQAAFERCRNNLERANIQEADYMAGLMGVSRERLPQVFCKRIVAAIVSGRLTAKDLYDLDANRNYSRFVNVIKGR